MALEKIAIGSSNIFATGDIFLAKKIFKKFRKNFKSANFRFREFILILSALQRCYKIEIKRSAEAGRVQ